MLSPQSVSIFLVDDNSLCLTIYRKYLLNLGFTNVQCFESGLDCIANIEERPDIIFLDYFMPPIDGLDTLKKIKALYPGICIVMLSAQADTDIAVQSLKCGAFDYIVKGQTELVNIQGVLDRFIQLKNIALTKQCEESPDLESFAVNNRWYNKANISAL